MVRTTPAGNTGASEDFVFVVGCPRSGTYLLSLILNAECGIAIPVETHFIPLFGRFSALFGDLTDADRRMRLLQCIFDFLEIWTPRSERGRSPDVIRRYSLLSVRPYGSRIVANSSCYGSLVEQLFKEYARLHGMPRAGDKSAFFRHMPLDTLADLFPSSRIIHVIRDGRDVSLSWRGIWTGPITLAQSAAEWSAHLLEKRRWGAANPARYLEVRYEDLVAEPERIMALLHRYLGLPQRSAPLSFHRSELARALAGGQPHEKIASPLDPGNCFKWRKQMSASERELFEHVAGPALAAAGYEVLDLPPSVSRSVRCALQRVRGRLSLHEIQLQAKNLLPGIIMICRRLGISLPRLLNRRYPEFGGHAGS